MKRVQKFLSNAELDPDQIERPSASSADDTDAVVVEGGEFAWDTDEEESTLVNINMQVRDASSVVTSGAGVTSLLWCVRVQVKKGSLVAVVGTVGTGKSSLLSALLGEMEKVKGKVQVKVSYLFFSFNLHEATTYKKTTFHTSVPQM